MDRFVTEIAVGGGFNVLGRMVIVHDNKDDGGNARHNDESLISGNLSWHPFLRCARCTLPF